VIRALVLYDAEPDRARFEKHAELCRQVPGVTFRHGRVFGAPMGEPTHRYYAEFEWADMDAFKAGARSPEFMATGKDAMELGVRYSVEFAEVD
jgi:heme-degrading monooxygenase HmoA